MSIVIKMQLRRVFSLSFVSFLFFCILTASEAQVSFSMRWSRLPELKIVSRFDRDKDGLLNELERRAASEFIRKERELENLSVGSYPNPPVKTTYLTDLKRSAGNAVSELIDLYDDKSLRTLYLRFPDSGWFAEMMDFFKTDVEVPADLIIDGRVYAGVGVRFRGSSSYFMVRNSLKKSFSISINHTDNDQRLYGYRTLDLLNGHADNGSAEGEV